MTHTAEEWLAENLAAIRARATKWLLNAETIGVFPGGEPEQIAQDVIDLTDAVTRLLAERDE